MLYKGDKGVNDAARPPAGGPAEAGVFSALSLPWSIDRPTWMPDSPLKSLYTKQGGNVLTLLRGLLTKCQEESVYIEVGAITTYIYQHKASI